MKLSLNYALFASLCIAKGAHAFAPINANTAVVPSVRTFGITTNVYSAVEEAVETAPVTCKEMKTEADVRSLFYLWNDALATGDSRIVAQRYTSDPVLLATVSDVPRTDFDSVKDYIVAQRYTSDPVLLATVSDVPRTDFDSVKDYFDAFLLKKPQGEIVEGFVKMGKGWCSDTGIYEFTMGATGDKVKARYSYVYVQEDGVWKIQHHHSSVMPEAIAMGKPITESEVRDLFQLWNGALATMDPKQVASRYAKNGVLLPTVSDVPRTDFNSIQDYFTSFLTKKPQGEILQSEVTIGKNWCQDVGIYEFTFGATGDKVKGRYSFVYVYEDGEWKISHHHSSVMPEGIVMPTSITESEVKGLFKLWNNALATKDPKKVAARYSKNGVLLPTVSDVPRTDNAGIVDYFTNFLKLKPQGEILESNVIVGANWAQDAGLYEFTMGATGAKVKGRYSFVYIFEDGEWK
eukprot:CAMPEP_0196826946 /NCGR_PEP_ID=MMETSP1362-20130617/93895_1 /TAXON_ID=163516 /ORGANISM="Leptocylindrus danicus, Strain CCMP1856" /LENGTH=461 /DNA_ID=CAMNT_0042207551 /DNA_START=92 /DNA_END=1474 /DNA_ORIENTATION=-